MNITRRNHYVPVWYQKGFLHPNQTAYHYLDLSPPRKKLANGKMVSLNDLRLWGPKKCFVLTDLYTTKFGDYLNDEVEKFLFGTIDTKGAKAIEAFINGDFHKLSKLFQTVFEYIDAQKIRTPKGLSWIKQHYFNLSQWKLMEQMQYIRQMHCTMWMEGVSEIVSANNSDVKFIISDHPVTIYNRAFPPKAKSCLFPNDPSTSLIGSQTIFPLDSNNCLILTNLEYAENPKTSKLKKNRTNARSFGQTLVRIDATIRSRELTEEEVVGINYIIKRRATKYIAAPEQEWLYPEKKLKKSSWIKLGQILMPPAKELYRFGGEIFAGGDGKLTWHQDAYGRRFGKPNKELQKLDITQRNIILINAITKIFGFSEGKDWTEIRKNITEDQVRELHKVIAGLWHPSTDIMSMLPKPDKTLRSLYFGLNDPRLVSCSILSQALYCDQVIVISPFLNAWNMNEKFDPIKNPRQYLDQTIRNISFFMQIAPLIEAGIVIFIPDPCDFNYELRRRSWDMALKRRKGVEETEEEKADIEPLMKGYYFESFYNLPPDSLKKYLESILEEEDKANVDILMGYISRKKERDPFVPLQEIKPGEENAQIRTIHSGSNLETAFFLAQLTGASIHTDLKQRYNELMSAVNVPQLQKALEQFSAAISQIQFPFFRIVDASFVWYLRDIGRFKTFRDFLRKLKNNMLNVKDITCLVATVKVLYGEVVEIKKIIATEKEGLLDDFSDYMKKFSIDSHIDIVEGFIKPDIPIGGFGFENAYQLLLVHGGAESYMKTIPFVTFLDLGKERFSDFS